jgi:hypothetical protein
MMVDFADKTVRGSTTNSPGEFPLNMSGLLSLESARRLCNASGKGDFESWTVEWAATADAVAEYAASMAAAGEAPDSA